MLSLYVWMPILLCLDAHSPVFGCPLYLWNILIRNCAHEESLFLTSLLWGWKNLIKCVPVGK